MHRIVDEVQKKLGPLASDAVFATGWSNGGYLSSLLGVTPHSAFKAVAPIAGYVYDGFDAASSPVPLFQHHGREDPMVRYEGCCTGDGAECCCGISDAGGERCVSAPDSFRRWGHDVNHCADAAPARSYTGACPCVVRLAATGHQGGLAREPFTPREGGGPARLG